MTYRGNRAQGSGNSGATGPHGLLKKSEPGASGSKSSRTVRARLGLGLASLLLPATLGLGCGGPQEEAHTELPDRPLGRNFFALVCDRVGGLALREDFTGSSYARICHPDAQGQYEDKVRRDELPPIEGDARNKDGRVVTAKELAANRERRIARIEALVRHREDMIQAFEAMVPEVDILTRVPAGASGGVTCSGDAPTKVPLRKELVAFFGRMLDSELSADDVSLVVETFGSFLNTAQEDVPMLGATARIMNRDGFQPNDRAVGYVQRLLSYPRLVEMLDAMSHLVVRADGQNPSRRPQAGAGAEAFEALLSAVAFELRTANVNTAPIPMQSVQDAIHNRNTVISRPRTIGELSRDILAIQNPSFAQGNPALVLRRDFRGMPKVTLTGGKVPAPFVDQDGDGLADWDDLGRFRTTTGAVAPTPFFAPQLRSNLQRDTEGRVMGQEGGGPLYDYLDASQTYLAPFMGNLREVFEQFRQSGNDGLMVDLLKTSAALAGTREDTKVASGTSTTLVSGKPENNVSTIRLRYTGFQSKQSPLVDVLYSTALIAANRETQDFLVVVRNLIEQDPEVAARFLYNLQNLIQSDVSADGLLTFMETLSRSPDGALERILPLIDSKVVAAAGDPLAILVGFFDPKLGAGISGDFLPGMGAVIRAIGKQTIAHCDAFDSTSGKCTKVTPRNGIDVLADLIRTLFLPERSPGLVDRQGRKYVMKSDGTTRSPFGLAALAVDSGRRVVAAFDSVASQGMDGQKAKESAKKAMGALFDSFAAIDGTGPDARFRKKSTVLVLPPVLDIIHAQVDAQCRSAKAGACGWAQQGLAQSVGNFIEGPLFAAITDFMQVVEKDPLVKKEFTQFMEFALQDDTDHRGLSAMADLLQVMNDDVNLSPFFGLLGRFVADLDAKGTLRPTVLPSLLGMTSRFFDLGRDAKGNEDCDRQVDPNRALLVVLRALVTPIGSKQRAPISILATALGDVNRVNPAKGGAIDGKDTKNILSEVHFGVTDKASGLKRILDIAKTAIEN